MGLLDGFLLVPRRKFSIDEDASWKVDVSCIGTRIEFVAELGWQHGYILGKRTAKAVATQGYRR